MNFESNKSEADFYIKQSLQAMLTHQKIDSDTHQRSVVVLRVKKFHVDAYVWHGFDLEMIDDIGNTDGALFHVLKKGYRAFTNFDDMYLAMKNKFEKYSYKVIDRRNE